MKGIFITIIIILLVVIIGLVWYILKPQTGGGTGEIEEKEIISVYLERFPAGTEIGKGIQGIKSTTFYKDDFIGVTGEVNTPGKSTLTYEVLTKDGEMVQQGAPGMELEGSGGFGMCCITPPQEIGNYVIKLFLDGQEAEILSFEVIE